MMGLWEDMERAQGRGAPEMAALIERLRAAVMENDRLRADVARLCQRVDALEARK